MIKISVKSDIASFASLYSEQARKLFPTAARNALNVTAAAVREAEIREIKDVFDRPTPWTLGAVYMKAATTSSLTAEVGLKNWAGKGIPASRYLHAEVVGGERRLKRFERALRAIGVLPEGYFARPGDAAKLDQYGNMSPGQITQLLSYFKAFPEAGYRANITDKRKARMARGTRRRHGGSYFVGRPGDGRLPLGIWQRDTSVMVRGSGIRPILIFVQSANYARLFDFPYVAKMTVDREFGPAFEREMRTLIGGAT
jgi:hypothetical protein